MGWVIRFGGQEFREEDLRRRVREAAKRDKSFMGNSEKRHEDALYIIELAKLHGPDPTDEQLETELKLLHEWHKGHSKGVRRTHVWNYKVSRGPKNMVRRRDMTVVTEGPDIGWNSFELFENTPPVGEGDFVRTNDVMVVGTRVELGKYRDLMQSMGEDLGRYRFCARTESFWEHFFGGSDLFLDVSADERKIPCKILATGNIRSTLENDATTTIYGVHDRLEEIAKEFGVEYGRLEPCAP